jgi:hypothetical protein
VRNRDLLNKYLKYLLFLFGVLGRCATFSVAVSRREWRLFRQTWSGRLSRFGQLYGVLEVTVGKKA